VATHVVRTRADGPAESTIIHPTPPPAGIPELVGRLTDDSRRLVNDEARLAKLELGDAIHLASRGGLRLALGFGLGIIALVGLTVLLTVLIGNDLIGKAWAGALITGGIEIAIGAWLVWHGSRMFGRTDFTLGGARTELRTTVNRLKHDVKSRLS
jgi:hypothetical protein